MTDTTAHNAVGGGAGGPFSVALLAAPQALEELGDSGHLLLQGGDAVGRTDHGSLRENLVGEDVVVVHMGVDHIQEVVPSQLPFDPLPLSPHGGGAEARVDDHQPRVGDDHGHDGALEVIARPGQENPVAHPVVVDGEGILGTPCLHRGEEEGNAHKSGLDVGAEDQPC